MSAGEILLRAFAALLGYLLLPVLVALGEEAADTALRRAPWPPVGRMLVRPFAEVLPVLRRAGAAPVPGLRSDRQLTLVASWLPWLSWLAVFAVLPWSPGAAAADASVSLIVVLAAGLVSGLAVVLAGLSRGLPQDFVAAVRAAGSVSAVVLPWMLAGASFAMAAGSLSLDVLADRWSWWWPLWQLPAAALLAVSGMGLLRRAPLADPHDLSAALGRVAGPLTSYAGVGVLALLLATCWLGGWAGPWADTMGWLWLLLKTLLVLALLVLLPRRLPRLRSHELYRLAWTVLVPVALAQLALTAVVGVTL